MPRQLFLIQLRLFDSKWRIASGGVGGFTSLQFGQSIYGPLGYHVKLA
jgi:hypothetical protein